VLRGAAVYVAMLVLVRLSGKRTVGEFTPFDLVLVVLLGESVGGALIGEDMSLPGGLIVAAVLIGLNWLVGFLSVRLPLLDRIVEGQPVLVARDGEVFRDVLRRESLSMAEVEAGMRAGGCPRLGGVQGGVPEPNGHRSVNRRRS